MIILIFLHNYNDDEYFLFIFLAARAQA